MWSCALRLDVGSVPAQNVRMNLQLVKPMNSTARYALTLTPTRTGAVVTGAVEGNHNFIRKALGVHGDRARQRYLKERDVDCRLPFAGITHTPLRGPTMTAVTLAFSLLAFSGFGQDPTGQTTQPSAINESFEHYEAARKALSSDKLADVAPHAKQLAATVEAVGGTAATKAADALAAATTIEAAREHFGELSAILVPKFQEAQVPGATAFMCAMKKQRWMQRGNRAENPYYGKSMLTCGTPIKPQRK